MYIARVYKDNPTEINTHFKKDKTHYKGLHEMNMEEIILLTKIWLNKYHQLFFEQYKDEISKLDILRNDRNLFAHSKMDFFEHDTSIVLVSELVNKLKIRQVKYKIADLKEQLIKHQYTISKVLDLLLNFIQPDELQVEQQLNFP